MSGRIVDGCEDSPYRIVKVGSRWRPYWVVDTRFRFEQAGYLYHNTRSGKCRTVEAAISMVRDLVAHDKAKRRVSRSLDDWNDRPEPLT